MATLKLQLDETEAMDFHLLAIHTSLDDFRLAYFLNQSLSLRLRKNPEAIRVKNKLGHTSFSRFSYEDTKNEVFWDLMENENETTPKQASGGQGLFSESKSGFTAKDYLLPEFKKADFLLKIDAGDQNIAPLEIVAGIKAIPTISTAYPIDITRLKSKTNLIF